MFGRRKKDEEGITLPNEKRNEERDWEKILREENITWRGNHQIKKSHLQRTCKGRGGWGFSNCGASGRRISKRGGEEPLP